MGVSTYAAEIERLPSSYARAMTSDISGLKSAIVGASESSLIAVGSGGSYTVASVLCRLHEAHTGRVSRAATPLEIICNPSLAASSPVFFISAEGKNPDAREALVRARRHSARPMHVLTNHLDSPLSQEAARHGSVTTHILPLAERDGYLATNSVLLTAVAIARTYGELSTGGASLPHDMDELGLQGASIAAWLDTAAPFVAASTRSGAMLVIYSPHLAPVAADLESKLAESALMHCQLADLRSFAHGRHLWLANRANDISVVCLVDDSLAALWRHTQSLLPPTTPTLTLPLADGSPRSLVAALIAEMSLVNRLGASVGVDFGRPEVPPFGRELYYADVGNLIPEPGDDDRAAGEAKESTLGVHWPRQGPSGRLSRALLAAREVFRDKEFRAIVFDYDGTLAPSSRRDDAPPPEIVAQLTRLCEARVVLGIASGRGDSIQERLADVLPYHHLVKIELGLYNGGWVGDATRRIVLPSNNVEFLNHVCRVVEELKQLGAPIERIKPTHPYQVSIRFREGISTDRMWFVVADALRQSGLDPLRMVKSKHSIDVVCLGFNKDRLVGHIIGTRSVSPYEIVTIGDQGAWPGNDSALLEHRFSLSVDVPSRRIDRGWKLAPAHCRDVEATLWYLERVELRPNGRFVLNLDRADS